MTFYPGCMLLITGLTGGFFGYWIGRALEKEKAEAQFEARSQELHSIDEALARRPALADLKYRYEKVYRACEMAGKTEALSQEVYLCKKQFAEFCERNAGDIVELRTQSSNLLTQVEALSGQLQGDLN